MTLRRSLGWLFVGLAAVACVITAISVIHSNLWWIRVLDFPRPPMLGVIVLVTVGCALFARSGRMMAIAGLFVAGGYQLWRIADYTPLVAVETALTATSGTDPACFSAIGLNVLQHNRDYARTVAMLRREQPDVILLMEADPRWQAALRPVLATYPHRALRPLDNTYGMIFASRLPVASAHFEQPTSADTPTLYARLATRAGRPFDYVGLHPRPPLPGQDTDKRDANIARAAHRSAADSMPALAMGDFNDVAWSRTTQHFKDSWRISRSEDRARDLRLLPRGAPLVRLAPGSGPL